MDTEKTPQLALNLPKIVALLIVYGRHIIQMHTNNTWVPNPSPALAAVTTDIDALEASQATSLTRGKGTAAARNLKRKQVVNDLTSLKNGAQAVMNQNPSQAVAIAETTGFALKRIGKSFKPNLAAKMTATPTQVAVRARAVKGAFYEWQYSLDGGKTWIAMGVTTVANTSVLGMTAGTTCLFRFRTTIKQTTSDWSQILSFFVH